MLKHTTKTVLFVFLSLIFILNRPIESVSQENITKDLLYEFDLDSNWTENVIAQEEYYEYQAKNKINELTFYFYQYHEIPSDPLVLFENYIKQFDGKNEYLVHYIKELQGKEQRLRIPFAYGEGQFEGNKIHFFLTSQLRDNTNCVFFIIGKPETMNENIVFIKKLFDL